MHRLATELVPAYFSLLGPRHISPFWCVLFYLSLIMLGIAQTLATFHTLIQGLIAIKPAGLKAWEGSITFAVCSLGFILGLPAATEVGTIIDINLRLNTALRTRIKQLADLIFYSCKSKLDCWSLFCSLSGSGPVQWGGRTLLVTSNDISQL